MILPSPNPEARPTHPSAALRFGALTLDPASVQVLLNGHPVGLTRMEFGILHHLITHTDRIVPAEELVSHVLRGVHRPNSSLVRVHVCHLRRKLGVAARALQTVRGRGVRFDVRKLVTVPSLPSPSSGTYG